MPPRSPIAQRDKLAFDAVALRERCAAAQPLLVAACGGATVLPHERVVQRLAALRVPHANGLALVR